MVFLKRTDSRIFEAGNTHSIDGNTSGSSRLGAEVSLSRTLSGNWRIHHRDHAGYHGVTVGLSRGNNVNVGDCSYV